MSATVAPAFGDALGMRVRVFRAASVLYVVCVVVLATGFYAYWIFGKYKVFYFAWAACLLLAGVSSFRIRLWLDDALRGTFPVLVWLLYLLTTALWSPSPRTTVTYVGVGLLYPVAFLLSFIWARTVSRPSLAFFFELQLLMLLPLMLWSMIASREVAVLGLVSGRNEYASRIITATPFVVWQLRNRPGVGRGVLLLVSLIAMVAVQSRALILVAPVMLFASWVFIQRTRGRIRSAMQILGLAGAAGVLALAVPRVRDTIGLTLGRFGRGTTKLDVSFALTDRSRVADDQTDIERRVQLAVAARSFLDHPLVGGGYFSTLVITGGLLASAVSAHGLPSTLLGETGLIGTAVFGWLVVRYFRRLARARRSAPDAAEKGFLQACAIAMTGVLMFGLFHQVDQSWWFWVLLAWGHAAQRHTARPA